MTGLPVNNVVPSRFWDLFGIWTAFAGSVGRPLIAEKAWRFFVVSHCKRTWCRMPGARGNTQDLDSMVISGEVAKYETRKSPVQPKKIWLFPETSPTFGSAVQPFEVTFKHLRSVQTAPRHMNGKLACAEQTRCTDWRARMPSLGKERQTKAWSSQHCRPLLARVLETHPLFRAVWRLWYFSGEVPFELLFSSGVTCRARADQHCLYSWYCGVV